ncbi:MAG: hypothetical protein AAF456_25870, partial [Planctomycetota bacterium]
PANIAPFPSPGDARMVALLCLICVGNPNFHSFCHLVGQTHQHSADSIYSHNPDAGASSLYPGTYGAFDENGHDSVDLKEAFEDLQRTLPAIQGISRSSLVCKVDAKSANGSVPGSPDREPGESDGPYFCLHLFESEACSPASYELDLDQALPALDDPDFSSTGFSVSAELGTIGARGPPLA